MNGSKWLLWQKKGRAEMKRAIRGFLNSSEFFAGLTPTKEAFLIPFNAETAKTFLNKKKPSTLK